MTTLYKVLGQVSTASTSLTPLYTVPTGRQAVISTLTVTDVNNLACSFAVSVAVAGEADDKKQYLYGSPTAGLYLDPGDTFIATVGITLGPGDVVNVRNISDGSTQITFQLFGSEIY